MHIYVYIKYFGQVYRIGGLSSDIIIIRHKKKESENEKASILKANSSAGMKNPHNSFNIMTLIKKRPTRNNTYRYILRHPQNLKSPDTLIFDSD